MLPSFLSTQIKFLFLLADSIAFWITWTLLPLSAKLTADLNLSDPLVEPSSLTALFLPRVLKAILKLPHLQ